MSDVERAVRLVPGDETAYLVIRREMLTESPWAFGSSVGDDRGLDVAGVRARLGSAENAVMGVWDAAAGERRRFLAVAGVMREEKIKRRHAAMIVGVFAMPEARGRGAGRAVVQGAIDLARSWEGVEQVELCVSERATAAKKLYESLGFQAWGVQPNAIRVDGRGYDETYMTLRF